MMKFLPLVAGLFLFLSYGCESEKVLTSEELLAHIEAVREDSIKGHIAYLADDKLLGRLPGTPEYQLAIDYVINKYREIGVLPAGDQGTFLQEVTIRQSHVTEGSSYLALGGDTLQMGEDYFFLGNLVEMDTETNGEVLFVGYGIEAPGLGYNDYENTDVKGKILLMASGAPEDFPSNERAYFSSIGTKLLLAEKHGAAGVFLTIPPGRIQFSALYDRYKTQGNKGIKGGGDEVYGMRTFSKDLGFVSYVNWEKVDKFMGTTGITADSLWSAYSKKSSYPRELNIQAHAAVTCSFSEFKSANVVGKIEGSDKKEEYIVHSAHLDHVGIGKPVAGDSIYNGAHDNASGVASLLEIARLYATLPAKPSRSVLFLMVTAEEMGLLGSLYFASHPTVPKEQIIANVNTDMPTLIAPLMSIEPLGAKHSSIMTQVEKSAGLLQVEIMDDHMPEQVRFVRSDQYSFILQGIPSLHVKYGIKTGEPGQTLQEKIKDFTDNVYHKPSDELNNLFDFEAARTYVKLNFLISYFINEEEQRPLWKEGDFFGTFVE
ncbi:MAG: M28 family peptidase [Cyclobacteriaceae bacterium]|nr:M28 family peptidase [Cyclobacteriaceae bacterium]